MSKKDNPIARIVEDFFNFRLSRNWSLRKTAKKIGCNHAYLYRVEAGEKNPSEKILLAMVRLMRENI